MTRRLVIGDQGVEAEIRVGREGREVRRKGWRKRSRDFGKESPKKEGRK